MDYTANRYINDRLEFFGDVGYRSFVFDNALTRLNIRPGVEYGPNDKWDFTGGIGFFYEIRPDITNRLEVRPFQGVRYHIDPSDPLKLNLYFRSRSRNTRDGMRTDSWRPAKQAADASKEIPAKSGCSPSTHKSMTTRKENT